MTWSETPTISIIPANLGNRLYQFFAARTLIERCGVGTVSNADFPEWGLFLPREDPERYRKILWIKETEDFDIDYIAHQIKNEPSTYVINKSPLQKQSLYLSKDYYNALLPIISAGVRVCGENEILINIRSNELLTGHPDWYPLTPVAFYQDIVSSTGLSPVFMGQLPPCRYIANLREAFPDAEFIDSQGVIQDFDTIRLARNIIPATSTFSLAAAWMSNASVIFLPLNGFLNPAHRRDIDLVPIYDQRYKFYSFPMNYALPEDEALKHHEKMAGKWCEISRQRVMAIQRNAPFLGKAPSVNSFDNSGFNERAYVHEHLDVALDISNGWYDSGLHHYLDIGRSRGYGTGVSAAAQSVYPNLALHRQAWQSSISPWSKGMSSQQDAMLAVNGDRGKADGFHTDFELTPWWIVDCGEHFLLKEMHIYNRKGARALQERASPLLIETSLDKETWATFAQTFEGELFGVEPDEMVPLTLKATTKTVARFVRISISGKISCLHLAEVEVYGIPL